MTTPQNPEPTETFPTAASDGPPPPPATPPPAAAADVPVVPYGGNPANVGVNFGQVPGVVNINGHDIHLGEGHPIRSVFEMLKLAAGSHTPGTAPVVTVNGQQIMAGVPVNLAAMFTPDQLTKIQQGITQLMQTHPEVAAHLQQTFKAGG